MIVVSNGERKHLADVVGTGKKSIAVRRESNGKKKQAKRKSLSQK